MPGPIVPLRAEARAKVNLSLHVRGRRTDGYHDIESLVVFAPAADTLWFEPGERLSLRCQGPSSDRAGPIDENLVLKAARAFAAAYPFARLGTFTLDKRLPVAAGLGGGSANAAAALRLLAEANGMAADTPDLFAIAKGIGADVPVCLAGGARMMRGIGERLDQTLSLPPFALVLVNPQVPVETKAVFAGLGLTPGTTHPGAAHPDIAACADIDDLAARLVGARNDLQPPAMALAPVIGEALSLLNTCEGCRLARMSGSGATCFGLFASDGDAGAAAVAIRMAQPGWWVAA